MVVFKIFFSVVYLSVFRLKWLPRRSTFTWLTASMLKSPTEGTHSLLKASRMMLLFLLNATYTPAPLPHTKPYQGWGEFQIYSVNSASQLKFQFQLFLIGGNEVNLNCYWNFSLLTELTELKMN